MTSVSSCGSDLIQSIPSKQNEGGSDLSTYFHIVCAIAGPSILGLPITMKQGGWVSIVLMVLSALMAYYTAVLIIECLYYKDTRLKTYAEIGKESFGAAKINDTIHYLGPIQLAADFG